MSGRDPRDVDALADTVAEPGALAMAFGQIDRTACYHPDQITPKSDTDHTVMLAWVAPSLAALLYPGDLDTGLVAQFASLSEEYAAWFDTALEVDLAWHKATRETAQFHGREPDELVDEWIDRIRQEPPQQRQEDDVFGRRARAAAREQARQQAEADRLYEEVDRLEAQGPNYRREITADRAARIMRQLAEPLASGDGVGAAGPVLQAAQLDAEIEQLAETFPEPRDSPTPSKAVLPSERAALRAPDGPPRVITHEEYQQRFGHLQGYALAEAIDRAIESGEFERGPHGPIITDDDREQTQVWLAEDRQLQAEAQAMPPMTREEEIAELTANGWYSAPPDEVAAPGDEPGVDAARWIPGQEQGEPAAVGLLSEHAARDEDAWRRERRGTAGEQFAQLAHDEEALGRARQDAEVARADRQAAAAGAYAAAASLQQSALGPELAGCEIEAMSPGAERTARQIARAVLYGADPPRGTEPAARDTAREAGS